MGLLDIIVLYKGPKEEHVKVYNGLIIKTLWLEDRIKLKYYMHMRLLGMTITH